MNKGLIALLIVVSMVLGGIVGIYAISQEDYDSRPAFTPPEILRSNLAEVILRMISLNLGHISSFPFLDRPNPRSIKDGFDLLVELGAIVRNGKDVFLTEKGRIMARMPLDPKISRMMPTSMYTMRTALVKSCPLILPNIAGSLER